RQPSGSNPRYDSGRQRLRPRRTETTSGGRLRGRVTRMDERNIGLTRREFLKDTAAVSAGVAAFGGLAPARILGANDRIRLGLLGAGQRGDYVMTVFAGNPDVEVVAICDVYEPHRLKAQLDSKAQPQLHTDYREVLDRKDVDAVLIA